MANQDVKQTLRPSDGGLAAFRIADEIARVKASELWKSSDRQAVSLVKDKTLNVLLMVLKKDAHLQEHRTKGPIVLQAVEGSVRFKAGGTSRTIARGEMVALDREVPHSVEAIEDSALLLVTAID